MDSDSRYYAIGGLIALVLSLAGWLGDRRHMRRSEPDAVGFMPWRDVAFWATLAACVLLALAAREWIAG